MEDPVVGGYTKEKIALRRAIGMAYNTSEETRVVWQGQADPATQFLPPHVFGFDPARKDLVRFDPAAAKALLDRFGYVDRNGDGWRDLPDGKPLTLVVSSQPAGLERQLDELWKKCMDAVGIRVDFNKQKWPDLAEGRTRRAIADVHARQRRDVDRWLQLFRPAVGQAGGLFESRAVCASRIRPPVRAGPAAAERARAPQAHAPDVGSRHCVRAVEVRHLPLREHRRPSVGSRLQAQCFNSHHWKYYDLDLARRAAAK